MNEQMICVFFASGHVDRRVVYSKGIISDELIDEVVAKCLQSWEKSDESAWLPVLGWARVGAGYFPADNTFRNAWRHSVGTVVVDMQQARELWKNRLRRARKPLLEANDIALRDALAEGDTAKRDAAIARRDALLAVTDHPAIAAAATPEQLKAVWPDALK